MSWGRNDWAPYVPVAGRIRGAVRYAAQLAKKQKRDPAPVTIQGRTIAQTFWGKAWCDNLTAYQDYSNRLPRGATYVRNGSVVDLVIHPKKIDAIVAGSTPYTVNITISELPPQRWKSIRSECSESIDSLLDLLSGKLSDGVMKRLTDQKTGLFPSPKEIRMSCSCPDYSSCCKHLAAVMYAVGARLDTNPELLFLLRGVDHQELVSQAMAAGNLDRELSVSADNQLGTQDLSELFGIELDSSIALATGSKKTGSRKTGSGKKKAPSRKAVKPAASNESSGKQKKVKKVPSARSSVNLKVPPSGKTKSVSDKPGTKLSAAKKRGEKPGRSSKTAALETKVQTKKKVSAVKATVAGPVAKKAKRPNRNS